MTRTLIFVRHGQSEWNLKNLFTGWRDPNLTENGIAEARRAGQKLLAKGFRFDLAFTSKLSRAQKTLEIILNEVGQSDLQIEEDEALNERDYGDLTGLNKDEAKLKWGADQIQIWRRSYDVSPPGGESLKDTLARALPYYIKNIQPHVLRGQTIIVVAHGNSLRSLIMAIEGMAPKEILDFELETGVPVIYKLNEDSTIASREILGD